MQAKTPIVEKARESVRMLVDASGELSGFQKVLIAALIVVVAAGAGLSYIRSRPRATEVRIEKGGEQVEKSASLMVHVAGAVNSPGLYSLEEGSRVADAVEKAGGPSEGALLEDLNMAARIKDGQKIMVPRLRDAQGTEQAGGGESGGLLNINTATAAELEELPGVGPMLAKRIVEYRKKDGPFSSIEDLNGIEGIGPKRIETLRGLVTI